MSRKATPAHFAERFRQLATDARRAGVAIIADADGYVRFLTQEESDGAHDLRHAGIGVKVTDGCGGGIGDRTGEGRWM